MSGTGRKSAYRKGVTEKYSDDLPEQFDGEICLITGTRGSNIFDVLTENSLQSLAMLPTKFRRLIWIRRGTYVIARSTNSEASTSAGGKTKVSRMIEHILAEQHIQQLQSIGRWPPIFVLSEKKREDMTNLLPTEDDDDDFDLVDGEESKDDPIMTEVNPNRAHHSQLYNIEDNNDDDQDS